MSALNIEHTVLGCEPEFADTQIFCDHYGYSVDEAANVLLIAAKKGEPKFAACVVFATCRLDVNKTARKKLGVSRISLWIDSRVMECKQIILGGGNRSSKIVLTPAMLLKIPNAEVVVNLAYEA